jgi:hypothetical protein
LKKCSSKMSPTRQFLKIVGFHSQKVKTTTVRSRYFLSYFYESRSIDKKNLEKDFNQALQIFQKTTQNFSKSH